VLLGDDEFRELHAAPLSDDQKALSPMDKDLRELSICTLLNQVEPISCDVCKFKLPRLAVDTLREATVTFRIWREQSMDSYSIGGAKIRMKAAGSR
jgi:hypothetical protein